MVERLDNLEALPIGELVALVLAWSRDGAPSNEPHVGMGALIVLHARPSQELYGLARGFLRSEDTDERFVGLKILGEFGRDDGGGDSYSSPGRPFRNEIVELLSADLDAERDPTLRSVAVAALGFWRDERAIVRLLDLVNDPSADVRYSLAGALTMSTEGEAPDERVIACLSTLAEDEDADVRYSAVFELAAFGLPESRPLFERHLNDPDTQVVQYAREGLENIGRRLSGTLPL